MHFRIQLDVGSFYITLVDSLTVGLWKSVLIRQAGRQKASNWKWGKNQHLWGWRVNPQNAEEEKRRKKEKKNHVELFLPHKTGEKRCGHGKQGFNSTHPGQSQWLWPIFKVRGEFENGVFYFLSWMGVDRSLLVDNIADWVWCQYICQGMHLHRGAVCSHVLNKYV